MESNDDPINKTGCVKRDMDGWDERGKTKLNIFRSRNPLGRHKEGRDAGRTLTKSQVSYLVLFCVCVWKELRVCWPR